jgi:small-conductance mechanosensitive channel
MDANIIQKRLQIIEDVNDELKMIKEQYNQLLEDNAQYQEVLEQERQLKAEYKEKKAHLTSSQMYQNYEEQMKEKRRDIKELKEVLAQEVADYYATNGKLEIEDNNGDTKKIRFSVRLTN